MNSKLSLNILKKRQISIKKIHTKKGEKIKFLIRILKIDTNT